MQILDIGFLELVDCMGDDLAIVSAARVSYNGSSKGLEADKRLLFYLMEHSHSTPFEMVEFKFHVKCPMFVARQWMRHRTWSYNEVSRRYTDSDPEFYYPEYWRSQARVNKQASDPIDTGYNRSEYFDLVESSVALYNSMIQFGVAKEQARMVLPQSLYTEFIAKVDAHNLMHFLKLRLSPDAQYEIREYGLGLFKLFQARLPWTAEAFLWYNKALKETIQDV